MQGMLFRSRISLGRGIAGQVENGVDAAAGACKGFRSGEVPPGCFRAAEAVLAKKCANRYGGFGQHLHQSASNAATGTGDQHRPAFQFRREFGQRVIRHDLRLARVIRKRR